MTTKETLNSRFNYDLTFQLWFNIETLSKGDIADIIMYSASQLV